MNSSFFSKGGGAEIFINFANFESKISAFENAGNDINAVAKYVEGSDKCKDIMLEQYVDRLDQIGTLLYLYQRLIEKDCIEIRKSAKTLRQADLSRASQMDNSGGGKS